MSIADGASEILPGWYPDPADAARLRRWDGQQWTQEVILAPEQQPAAPAPTPTAPPTVYQPQSYQPETHQSEPYQPQSYEPAPTAAPAQAYPTQAGPFSTPSSAPQPPPGRPVPASPAPFADPPGEPVPSPAPTTPTVSQSAPPVSPEPTVPRPSPPVNPNSHPSSGPVSLPEWATLPGLTLPPDLSSLPGMETDSVLHAPTFEESEKRQLPTPPVFEPPFIPQRPEVQDAGRLRSEQHRTEPAPSTVTAPSAPSAPPTPAAPYAPPPMGAQYDVPPPPGMAHVPTSGPVLPRSAFVAPQPQPTWPTLPPVEPVAQPAPLSRPTSFESTTTGVLAASRVADPSFATLWSWLIAVLPLLQFAVVYIVFGILGQSLAPGMQWGILAAPAAFSLLFANYDKKKLTDLGASSPSIIFALVPPLYLIVRCVTTGRSSVLPLVAWVLLQAGAAAGVYFLLPSVLAAGIRAFG